MWARCARLTRRLNGAGERHSFFACDHARANDPRPNTGKSEAFKLAKSYKFLLDIG